MPLSGLSPVRALDGALLSKITASAGPGMARSQIGYATAGLPGGERELVDCAAAAELALDEGEPKAARPVGQVPRLVLVGDGVVGELPGGGQPGDAGEVVAHGGYRPTAGVGAAP